MRTSVGGLMDRTNVEYEQAARAALSTYCREHHTSFHRLRLRESGQRVYVDFHIVFDDGTPIEDAHRMATEAEQCVVDAIDHSVEVLSHLESTNVPDGHDD
ncbi:MAG: cation transporter dimerization domain-containing protein, partial [Candidatus Kapaibacterium sp.]